MSLPVIAGGWGIAACALGLSLRKLTDEEMVRTALFSSVFFVASLIHIPLGPTSVHLVLNGLTGVLLGWPAIAAIAVALLLQALLFQYGGITALGANIVIMGMPALVVWRLLRPAIQKKRFSPFVGGGLAGGLAVALSAVLMSTALVLSGDEFVSTAIVVLAAHVPVIVIDGLIGGLALQFIGKVKPELVF